MAEAVSKQVTISKTQPTDRPGGFGRGPHGMMGPPAKAKDAKGTLKRLWGYLAPQRRALLAVFGCVLFSSGISLAGPYLIGVAIDNYILPGDFQGLLRLCLLMLALYLSASGVTWLQNHLMIEAGQKTVWTIRRRLFEKVQTLPLKFFDSRSHGELMSRLTNDVDNISNTLSNSITQVFSSGITLAGTLIAMLMLSPLLTLFSVLVIPIMGLSTQAIAKRTRKFFSEQQKVLGDLNGFVEETISGQRVVKVFTQEEAMMADFSEKNQRLKGIGIRAQVFSGLIPPLMNVINNLSFAIIAVAGGWLALRDVITVGIIASFITYSRQFTWPLNELANQFNMVQSGIAGAERVFEVMDEDPEPEDAADAKAPTDIKGSVDFSGVDFGYTSEIKVLKDIHLKVRPGQTIALVGPTGAGKTTIINLLTRFYDIDGGSISIDGADIRTIQRDRLRSLLGIVLQDTYLFSESVRENIRYGRLNATDAEVEEAAKLANAHPFISRLSEGYDTVLSDDGGNLSQGQRQLLAIARAILADPAILILDEATSSVDTRTEVHIQEAMLTLMEGRTCFVIAHRLSTIRNADAIVVIDDGRILEQGTHEELLQRRGFYHDLYMSQFEQEAPA